MNLIWFLTIAAILASVLGEFGKYPILTNSGFSVSLVDILVSVIFFLIPIWQIGIKKRVDFPVSLKILFVFWLICFLSLLLNFSFSGGLYLIRFMVYSLTFWVGFQLIRDNQTSFKNILLIYILGGIIISLMGFVQFLIFPDLSSLTGLGYDPHKNRLAGAFLDPNFTGTYLSGVAILLTGLFIKEKKIFYLVLLLIVAVADILTFSRSAYLMLLVGITSLGVLKEKRILILLTAFIVVLLVFLPKFTERIQGAISLDKSASERIESWQNGLTVFKSSPIYGVGFNNLRQAYDSLDLVKNFSKDGGHSGAGVDSSLILVLATTGIIGIVVYLSFWISLLFFMAKSYKKTEDPYSAIGISFILAILINSQFINSLFYPPIMLSYFILMGALIGLKKTK
jgi:O-antigen ligase